MKKYLSLLILSCLTFFVSCSFNTSLLRSKEPENARLKVVLPVQSGRGAVLTNDGKYTKDDAAFFNIALTRDGAVIASKKGLSGETVYFYDIEPGEVFVNIEAWTDYGVLVASGSSDGEIKHLECVEIPVELDYKKYEFSGFITCFEDLVEAGRKSGTFLVKRDIAVTETVALDTTGNLSFVPDGDIRIYRAQENVDLIEVKKCDQFIKFEGSEKAQFIFDGNSGTYAGGSLVKANASFTAVYSKFINNHSISASNAALWLSTAAKTVTLENCYIGENTCTEGLTAGIQIQNGTVLQLVNTVFGENTKACAVPYGKDLWISDSKTDSLILKGYLVKKGSEKADFYAGGFTYADGNLYPGLNCNFSDADIAAGTKLGSSGAILTLCDVYGNEINYDSFVSKVQFLKNGISGTIENATKIIVPSNSSYSFRNNGRLIKNSSFVSTFEGLKAVIADETSDIVYVYLEKDITMKETVEITKDVYIVPYGENRNLIKNFSSGPMFCVSAQGKTLYLNKSAMKNKLELDGNIQNGGLVQVIAGNVEAENVVFKDNMGGKITGKEDAASSAVSLEGNFVTRGNFTNCNFEGNSCTYNQVAPTVYAGLKAELTLTRCTFGLNSSNNSSIPVGTDIWIDSSTDNIYETGKFVVNDYIVKSAKGKVDFCEVYGSCSVPVTHAFTQVSLNEGLGKGALGLQLSYRSAQGKDSVADLPFTNKLIQSASSDCLSNSMVMPYMVLNEKSAGYGIMSSGLYGKKAGSFEKLKTLLAGNSGTVNVLITDKIEFAESLVISGKNLNVGVVGSDCGFKGSALLSANEAMIVVGPSASLVLNGYSPADPMVIERIESDSPLVKVIEGSFDADSVLFVADTDKDMVQLDDSTALFTDCYFTVKGTKALSTLAVKASVVQIERCSFENTISNGIYRDILVSDGSALTFKNYVANRSSDSKVNILYKNGENQIPVSMKGIFDYGKTSEGCIKNEYAFEIAGYENALDNSEIYTEDESCENLERHVSVR